jgi:hypothetical protein
MEPLTVMAAGAGIQAGATLLAGYWQNQSNRDMNAQNLELAYTSRADQFDANRRSEAFNREQFAFNKRMALNDRSFRDRMAAYEQRKAETQSAIDRFNNSMALKQNALNAFNSSRRL